MLLREYRISLAWNATWEFNWCIWLSRLHVCKRKTLHSDATPGRPASHGARCRHAWRETTPRHLDHQFPCCKQPKKKRPFPVLIARIFICSHVLSVNLAENNAFQKSTYSIYCFIQCGKNFEHCWTVASLTAEPDVGQLHAVVPWTCLYWKQVTCMERESQLHQWLLLQILPKNNPTTSFKYIHINMFLIPLVDKNILSFTVKQCLKISTSSGLNCLIFRSNKEWNDNFPATYWSHCSGPTTTSLIRP